MSKILVIEDKPNILEELVTWLELENYEALGALDGTTGINLALEQHPDLILCDIMMPEKDGYQVLLELRAYSATARTPFIFLTAKQEKIDIRYGMELGADDYIAKPIDRKALLNAIHVRLARYNLFDQHAHQQINDLRQSILRALPHELRTPLMGILARGELLSEATKPLTLAETRVYGKSIVLSGQRLQHLIENYLLYVQLERYASEPQQIDNLASSDWIQVTDFIGEASTQVAALHKRQAHLYLAVQPGRVRIPGKHLVKIVQELVDNAFKFSTAPAPVQVTGNEQANQYVLAIADQGRGLAAENLALIGAYMQFERSLYEQQGLGLGLVLAHRLTTLYGGQFQIKSTVGVGTTALVMLPLG